MSFHVQRQVVGPGERAVAQPALERPVTGMLAEVPGQLVGPSELPTATIPIALVRFFTRVRAQVRLEMRALGVRLSASRVTTRVVGRRLFGALRPPFTDASRPPRRSLAASCGRLCGHHRNHFDIVFGRRRRRRHHGRSVSRGRGSRGRRCSHRRGRLFEWTAVDYFRFHYRRRRDGHQLARQERRFGDRVSVVAVVRWAGRRRYLLLMLLLLLLLE